MLALNWSDQSVGISSNTTASPVMACAATVPCSLDDLQDSIRRGMPCMTGWQVTSCSINLGIRGPAMGVHDKPVANLQSSADGQFHIRLGANTGNDDIRL